jgi:hypothetical protein
MAYDRDVGELEGIKLRLDNKGMGTFKFKIKDDNGMTHKIRILNSLYVPELRRCLLSPQHWMQELNDNYPRSKQMDQDVEFYYLNWGHAKYRKLVPYVPLFNVPIMYTITFSRTYCVFATTFEVLEAHFF